MHNKRNPKVEAEVETGGIEVVVMEMGDDDAIYTRGFDSAALEFEEKLSASETYVDEVMSVVEGQEG